MRTIASADGIETKNERIVEILSATWKSGAWSASDHESGNVSANENESATESESAFAKLIAAECQAAPPGVCEQEA